MGGEGEPRLASVARMYDYLLGGSHHFPVDREAARTVIAQYPSIQSGARANRAFLRRAVRYLAGSGLRQFLDLGSGIPTQGNVHEVAQGVAPEARVVYVDIDPLAVAESQRILDGNRFATAIHADVRKPEVVLEHSAVRDMLDLGQPTALLLAAVLHFVPDDGEAYHVVERFMRALPSGSYLLISHVAVEGLPPERGDLAAVTDVYRRQTTMPATVRTKAEVEAFFARLDLVEPGVVWLPEWRPDPERPDPLADDPTRSCAWAGVARKP